jgi:hypothetical protein
VQLSLAEGQQLLEAAAAQGQLHGAQGGTVVQPLEDPGQA